MKHLKESSRNEKSLIKFIKMTRAFWKSKILLVANELNIFINLLDNPKTVDEISEKIATNPYTTELLLRALVSMDLIKERNGLFFNTEFSKKYLCDNSPSNICFALRHYNYCWNAWSELDKVIINGQPKIPLEHEMLRKEKMRTKDFTRMMDYTGWRMAPEIIKFVDFKRINNMLDIGGGSGCYSIYFCKKYSKLHSTIFELPMVAIVTKENILKYKLQERIDIVEGDIIKDQFTGQYDLVFLSFILHSLNKKEFNIILQKVHSILNKNGRLIIQEYLPSTHSYISDELTIFNLLMTLNTKGGRIYTLSEIKDCLNQSNFKYLKSIPLHEKSPFIIGRRPHLIVGRTNKNKGK